MDETGLPFAIVFTKMDKLSKSRNEKNVDLYRNHLLESWVELPPIFLSSVRDSSGREEILDYIDEQNKIYLAFTQRV
jgi:GTP-binding protein